MFLPLVIILYYLVNPKYRWVLLLAASYYFYMSWKVGYIILIVASTIVDYFAAIQIAKTDIKKRKKLYLFLSLGFNLGMLFFFKYYNFFADSLNRGLSNFNIGDSMPYFQYLLPVGISFYTFQTLSYTIDVYKGRKEPERHLGIFAVYVSYFPQLVAGPIERSVNLIPEFHKRVRFSMANLSEGFKLIVWGYFMKVVVADRAAIYVNAVYNNVEQHEGLTFLAASFLFSFQIYGDFAGYSLIAIGSSRLMGISLMQNFNRPYFAASIHDFWRRWHISLSTWFRDYLYIPLGGNRATKPRWLFNLFFTFLVSGLWHGANWTFIIWGALHGFYLIIEALTRARSRKGIPSILLTYLLVNLAWVFFRANSITDAFTIYQTIATNPGTLFIPSGTDVTAPVFALIGIAILLIIEAKKEYFNKWFTLEYSRYEGVRMAYFALILFAILYLGVFDESQFIYFQF
jgi:alginate O-acetyltransferase complex protein AlgI